MSNKVYNVNKLTERFRQAHAARQNADWMKLQAITEEEEYEQATKTQAQGVCASRAPGGRTQTVG